MTYNSGGGDGPGAPVLTEGWQPDPAVGGQERYFDGARWTNMTRPVGVEAKPITAVPQSSIAPPTRPAPTVSPEAAQQYLSVRPVGDVFGSPSSAKHRGAPKGLVVAIVVLLVAAAAGVFVARDSGPSHPDRWDPKVAALAQFVEAERGERFDHPVYVDFLSVEDFKAKVGDTGEVTEEDREEVEQVAGALRAVGLLSGNVDLTAMMSKLASEAVVGLYDFNEKRIFVRGDSLGASVRSTLVHELTHALQDQRFDLTKIQDEAASDAAVRALVEADAERIQDAYEEAMSPDEKKVLEQEEGQEADLEGVPDVLTQNLAFPYIFGPAFVQALLTSGGTEALNRAFQRPPTNEAEILTPSRYIEAQPLDLPPKPKLAKGEKAIDGQDETSDDFGQTLLVQLLTARVGFAQAWKAVEGWRGDRMSIFTETSGRVCVAANVRFDAAASATLFQQSAAAWAAAVKGTAVQSDRDVALRACDPGGDAPALTPGPDGDGFNILVYRSLVIAGALKEGEGVTVPQAVCLTDALVNAIGGARIHQALENKDAAALDQVEPPLAAFAACRAAA